MPSLPIPGVPCDAVAVARLLADQPGLSVLASFAPDDPFGGASYVACRPVDQSDALDPWQPPPASAEQDYPRFIGAIPYESQRARLERPAWTPTELRPEPILSEVCWQRYAAVVALDHARGEVHVVGEDPDAVAALAELLRRPALPLAPRFSLEVGDAEPARAHQARVAAAIELIYAGDLYQVNLARKLALRLSTGGSERLGLAHHVALLGHLGRRTRAPFGCLLSLPSGAVVVGASPELLLDAEPAGQTFGLIRTEPIKGTRPRGATPEDDRAARLALDADPKERAELAMIIDVERNDLARIAAQVTIERPAAVRAAGPVWHRSALLSARVRPGTSRRDVLHAMLPSGSVTGAPKVRAMEVIAGAEPFRRGLYTGGFGYVSAFGHLRLAMAIRTATFDPEGTGEYLVGGGIVADSDPARELEETRWKAVQLLASAAEDPM